VITGTVNRRLEATLPIRLFGLAGQQLDITAVIDTGYNGALTLPLASVSTLALALLGPMRVILGDTSQRALSFYSAEILWGSQRRVVRVLCVEGDPLVGTALLKGHRLEAEFEHAGNVLVSPLP
jgi:clan AA aspartic protease